jgi:hypothetical protein
MVHPLMASYGFVCVLLLACLSSRDTKVKTAAALGFFSAAILLAVYLFHLGMPQVGDYTQVARTRTYWFLDQWHWHERFGLAILTSIGLRRRGGRANVSMWLAQVGVVGVLLRSSWQPSSRVPHRQPLWLRGCSHSAYFRLSIS